MLRVYLKYADNGEPVIHGIERLSRPGRRVYRGKKEIPRVLGGLGSGDRLDLPWCDVGKPGRATTASAAKSSARSGKEKLMSRVGKKPIPLPKGVEVSQQEDDIVVKGPKGSAQDEARSRVFR